MASGDPLAGGQAASGGNALCPLPSNVVAGTARPSAGALGCWVSLLECVQVPRSLRFAGLL